MTWAFVGGVSLDLLLPGRVLGSSALTLVLLVGVALAGGPRAVAAAAGRHRRHGLRADVRLPGHPAGPARSATAVRPSPGLSLADLVAHRPAECASSPASRCRLCGRSTCASASRSDWRGEALMDERVLLGGSPAALAASRHASSSSAWPSSWRSPAWACASSSCSWRRARPMPPIRRSAAHDRAPIPVARGLMYDRKGRLLVENVPTFVLRIMPAELPFEERQEVAERIASPDRHQDAHASSSASTATPARSTSSCASLTSTPTPLGSSPRIPSSSLACTSTSRPGVTTPKAS